jgi:hypothetical protein
LRWDLQLETVGRDELQNFLEKKVASGLSASIVSHLRWDLRALFQLAMEDGLINRNPATSLVTPANASRSITRAMNRQEVVQLLSVLDLRERLISRLAIFAGMRPGEIFALKWRHIGEESAVIDQRLYRGKIGTPKTPPIGSDGSVHADDRLRDEGVQIRFRQRPTRRLAVPLGADGNAACEGQLVAPTHGAEVEKGGPAVGKFSGNAPDPCEPIKKGGHRSEGGGRSVGPWPWGQFRCLYEVGFAAAFRGGWKTRI